MANKIVYCRIFIFYQSAEVHFTETAPFAYQYDRFSGLASFHPSSLIVEHSIAVSEYIGVFNLAWPVQFHHIHLD